MTSLEPDCDADGKIVLHDPRSRYAKRHSVPLKKYGDGPFCRFRVPEMPVASGVYAYLADANLVYVGEASNLHARFYAYGNISPKNCYKGGRETNCRLNREVYRTRTAGTRIDVYVLVTPAYKAIEAQMIEELQPSWNRKGIYEKNPTMTIP